MTRSRAVMAGGGSLQLAQHSWWLYLDDGDRQNDWIVEERPLGSGGVCTLLWDAANGDWGIGAGCDISDTAVATDVGSAVRIVNGCSAGFDCVDFALERSDYPGLGSWPFITGASDKLENLSLAGETVRNPTDGLGGCSPPTFDDCTTPVGFPIQIPEFPAPAVVAAVAVLLLVSRRLRATRTGR